MALQNEGKEGAVFQAEETKERGSEWGMITSQDVEGWEEEEQAGVEGSPRALERYVPPAADMDELCSGAGGASQPFSRTLPATPEERQQVLTGERAEARVVRTRPPNGAVVRRGGAKL